VNEQGTSGRRTQLIVLGVLAAAILAAAIIVSLSGGDDEDSDSPAPAAEVEQLFEGIPQQGSTLGEAGAPTVVTEVVDMQCPFCAEFARNALPEVIEQQVRPGELKLQLAVVAFLGPDSVKAQEMAAAAQLQNRLWQFVETFYENQGKENSGYVTPEFLDRIAEEAGVDAAKAQADIDAGKTRQIVTENNAVGKAIGGTPTFLLVEGGGEEELKLSDLTADAFFQAIDAAQGG
jgi:protein-disulfide isomerase